MLRLYDKHEVSRVTLVYFRSEVPFDVETNRKEGHDKTKGVTECPERTLVRKSLGERIFNGKIPDKDPLGWILCIIHSSFYFIKNS